MARFEATIRVIGDYMSTVGAVTTDVTKGSISATLEEAIDTSAGSTNCSVRTLERYSAMGGNRVSLNIVFLHEEGADEIEMIATCTGGSNGPIKIIPWGENEFLDKLKEILYLKGLILNTKE